MNPIIRTSIAFLLATLLVSCGKYQRNNLPSSRLSAVDKEFLAYYLVDIAHPLTRVWYMSDCKIKDQEINCYLTRLAETEAVEVSLVRGNRDARQSKNDVLFYANPKFAATVQDTGTITISTDQLTKIEVFEMNHFKTIGIPLLSATGFLGLLFLINNGY